MESMYERTELLLGSSGIEKLKKAHVAIFGVGGVGGYVAEALARSGVGTLDVIDNDTVSVSNINRQLIAAQSTVGQYKTDVIKARLLDINPNIKVNTFKTFYTPQTAADFDFSQYDYVIDAIDTVTGKIQLVMQAQNDGVPIISSMGAGNKLNPAAFQVADIYKTSVCPLARVMRSELKKRHVKKLKVVYSQELPIKPQSPTTAADDEKKGAAPQKPVPGSVAFVPGVAGLIIAGEVVKDLCGNKDITK